MLTLAREEPMDSREFISAIPERIRTLIQNVTMDKLMEIRIRCGVAISIVCTDGIYYVTQKGHITQNYKEGVTATSGDIRRGMELVTRSSVYAFENEINGQEDYIFANCDNLVQIEFANAYIGLRMFDDCDALVDLTINSTVKHVRDYAFANCDKLANLTFAKTRQMLLSIFSYGIKHDSFSS